MQKLSDTKEIIDLWEGMEKETNELAELISMEIESKKQDKTFEKDLETRYKNLENKFEKNEFQAMFSGKYDKSNAIFAVHAGTGGIDAQDWAEMLLRMYLRFFEKKGFRVRMIEESRGAEAGIKSAVLEVKGQYAYGYLKTEAGVHRLVRISPFDAEQLRQTSFALVEAMPDLAEENEDIKINDKDLKIDTYRSSGPGGQNVNKTESAVRITHIPTGLIAACQSERSQVQNKETALRLLKAKLYQKYLASQQSEKNKIRGEYKSAEWSNQIRSYVLHPYKLVKDHRTGHETADTEKILNGELDEFIEAALKAKITTI